MRPLVKPFRALRYDERVVGPIDAVIAPPWDVITPELMAQLVAASPWNVIRLIRPHGFELAGERLREWIGEGALVRDELPAIWRIEETFVGPDGLQRTRRGLVARLRLEPYDRGVVLPHERIFPASAETRLALLRATRTKLSPVLVLHDGPSQAATSRPPDVQARLEGTTTRLWRVEDEAEIAAAVASVGEPLVIADGHHRYDAALRLHESEGTEETGYVLAALVSKEDEGLTIFPAHRLTSGDVPKLNGALRLTPLRGGAESALARLRSLSREHAAFVRMIPGETTLAEVVEATADPVERLDVAALERLALPDLRFTPSVAEVERALESGDATAAFLVRAPTVAEVQSIAKSGRTMPEKSTYFYPKLVSGLLFAPFDE